MFKLFLLGIGWKMVYTICKHLPSSSPLYITSLLHLHIRQPFIVDVLRLFYFLMRLLYILFYLSLYSFAFFYYARVDWPNIYMLISIFLSFDLQPLMDIVIISKFLLKEVTFLFYVIGLYLTYGEIPLNSWYHFNGMSLGKAILGAKKGPQEQYCQLGMKH